MKRETPPSYRANADRNLSEAATSTEALQEIYSTQQEVVQG